MIGQLLPNTNEMLQCILAIQILDLNTAIEVRVVLTRARCSGRTFRIGPSTVHSSTSPIARLLLHYCLLGVAGCGGRRIVWWEQQPKGSPCSPYAQANRGAKNGYKRLLAHPGLVRTYRDVTSILEENGMRQVFLIEKGASSKAG
jgi:hypothetical protein